MKASAQIEAEVMAVMNQYNAAYVRRDIAGLLALFATDADIVNIGTGKDEKRIGLEELRVQFERDFAQSGAVSIEYRWYSVSAAGSVAWVAADCVAQVQIPGVSEMTLPMRSTTVLEKRDGRWLIVQSHASLPAAEQSEGQSFPA